MAGPLTLLIVDDDAADRKLVRRLLMTSHPDARVSEASDADDAFGIDQDEIDAVLLDYRLPGVDGLDLLAWRYTGEVEALIARVAGAVGKPVVVAGSVVKPAQIAALCSAGAWGFTIGTAALDGVFPARAPGLAGQLAAILAAEEAAGFSRLGWPGLD